VAQPLYGSDAGGAAASRIHRKQRSFLLPLLTAQPMQTAQRRKWVAAANCAVVLFCCWWRSRRRRRSRFLLQLFSKQLLFLGRAQLFIGRYGQPLELVYRVKNELYTLFHFWCSIVLLCAASL